MGTKNNPGTFDCYANAEPDEPMFVLLARDPAAPYLVRRWAGLRPSDRAKVIEAMECADSMDAWRKEHRPHKKLDLALEIALARDVVIQAARRWHDTAGDDGASNEEMERDLDTAVELLDLLLEKL
jgi:hypothetical protein